MYGKLPTRQQLLNRNLKERKYFDSGDYAMSRAGQTPSNQVGSEHPEPEAVPHCMKGAEQQPQQPQSPVHRQSSLADENQ